MPPAYTNLYTSHFEESYIYNLTKNKAIFYKRFIDGIFTLCNGTLDQLKEFLTTINTLHPTIKFDAKYSFSSINFLNTQIYKSDDGKLHTTVHIKPTGSQSYLHCKSYHPGASKRSIAYSQALRIRRICSEDPEDIRQTKNLIDKLGNRGYDPNKISEVVQNVYKIRREQLLKSETKPQKEICPIIVTYHKNLPHIRKAINNNWHILSINKDLSNVFHQ